MSFTLPVGYKKAFTMRAIILFSVLAFALANQDCGENSHYESCGSACPLTCENFDNPPKFCILRCDIGCHCDKGYVKTNDGRCVRPEECPSKSRKQPVCGENQLFKECGSACPLTCDNYANPPRMCPAMCVYGCHCAEGYVKTSDGACVLPEECPRSAPVTEEKNCVDPPETGRCLAYFPSFYYDPSTGTCKEFIYGGCQGNGNRYSTEAECMKQCGGFGKRKNVEACDMPAETGVCRGFFPRYYFDRATGECQKFVYGGCGGNENNFQTKEDCHALCANAAAPSACQEEKAVGPCRGNFPRFFFNKETGKCEEFVYGGCLGNSNNFNSQEGCEAVCVA